MESCHLEIKFPHLWDHSPEGRLVRWLVPDGAQISMGQPLYEAEIGGETRRMPSVLNGRLEQVAGDGDLCRTRQAIARVMLTDNDRQVHAMKLYLCAGNEMAAFDARRGEHAPERFARDAFLDFLGLPPDLPGEGPRMVPVDVSQDREDRVISCPVMAMEATGARLIRWLVPDGQHVYKNQDLYEAEVDGDGIHEVPSMATGFVRQVVPAGTFRGVGEPFGEITRHEDNAGMCTVAVILRHSREMHVFRQKCSDAGAVHDQFIRESFLKILGLPHDDAGNGRRKQDVLQ